MHYALETDTEVKVDLYDASIKVNKQLAIISPKLMFTLIWRLLGNHLDPACKIYLNSSESNRWHSSSNHLALKWQWDINILQTSVLTVSQVWSLRPHFHNHQGLFLQLFPVLHLIHNILSMCSDPSIWTKNVSMSLHYKTNIKPSRI